jgi:hypothetical protein
MTAALYSGSTTGLPLALALFHHHQRNGITAPVAGLIEVPSLLHEMGIGTEPDQSDTHESVLRYLGILAVDASYLPWEGPIGDHIASAGSVAIAARLLAFLLPKADSSILRYGVIPVETWGDETALCHEMVQIARQLSTTSEHLQVLIRDTYDGWVDPQVIVGDVADIHDLARGYLTAARLLCALGVVALSR